jgi:hypothetical protein
MYNFVYYIFQKIYFFLKFILDLIAKAMSSLFQVRVVEHNSVQKISWILKLKLKILISSLPYNFFFPKAFMYPMFDFHCYVLCKDFCFQNCIDYDSYIRTYQKFYVIKKKLLSFLLILSAKISSFNHLNETSFLMLFWFSSVSGINSSFFLFCQSF